MDKLREVDKVNIHGQIKRSRQGKHPLTN
jgi:hypothetical protein